MSERGRFQYLPKSGKQKKSWKKWRGCLLGIMSLLSEKVFLKKAAPLETALIILAEHKQTEEN